MEKIINFEFGGQPPEDFQKVGYYYKSENDVSSHYIVEIQVKEETTNAIVKISVINSMPLEKINIGTKIAICDYELENVCEIDLWNKYFFPKFNNKRQLYYDDCERWKENEVTSMSDAMNYAIQKGLEVGKIKTY